jgi:hypothetical protein
MEEFVYAFTREEGLVFEVVTNEGDNLYWAGINGGVQLNAYDIAEILNGKDAGEVVNDIWKQMHHRV